MKTSQHERRANMIWSFMRKQEITAEDVAKACGHTTHSVTCNTIAGRKHNRKVLRFLITKGCPEKYLGLPKDMRVKS